MNTPHSSQLLYTTAQMRRIDACAVAALGLQSFELMQRAADAAFAVLLRRWPQARSVVVCCGSGKNGGDGYLLARLVRQSGRDVSVIALGTPADVDSQAAADAWRACGGMVHPFAGEHSLPLADVYVDALFGIGLNRPLEGGAALLVQTLNARRSPVLALDIPSGLSADTGARLGPCISATLTVSFIAWKRGQHTGAGLDACGECELADLALPDSVFEEEHAGAHLLDWNELRGRLPARSRDVHKGQFGHVLAIGGDHGTGGAIRLAGEAALRCGAGLVSVATQPEHLTALLAARPELMVQPIAGQQELEPLLQRAQVLALGPGLGTRSWGHALWHRALASAKPAVLDADALNLLARQPRKFSAPTVLTPHPAEAARLLASDSAHVQANRYAAAQALAERYHAVVVLKGAGSLIAAPAGSVAVCPWGNPGMASAGMGDVLTGVIAALLAQGLSAWDAACLGVAAHARAGDSAAEQGQRGLLAGDLLLPLRSVLAGLAHD
ncbi:NAD(P)H-hydrate epimerase [Tahibacter aquaticus]|uniref:Bifunctional NAD(P)H-hydrate repair enzyme n=1 Tax=Tahibacter aquaticus TaxID=520092 RepID=A0A4R6YWT9_9GAMM|nr:NAD(P)H-hydrate dehydratase [Tahibacter aquaticus]TDR43298.1 NAD(P)H-hydrate epimerase [Tahibacter aquaticus]